MSVLGLESEYTIKHALSPREFPWAAPSGAPLRSGRISSYIPPLLLIWIQSSRSKKSVRHFIVSLGQPALYYVS